MHYGAQPLKVSVLWVIEYEVIKLILQPFERKYEHWEGGK